MFVLCVNHLQHIIQGPQRDTTPKRNNDRYVHADSSLLLTKGHPYCKKPTNERRVSRRHMLPLRLSVVLFCLLLTPALGRDSRTESNQPINFPPRLPPRESSDPRYIPLKTKSPPDFSPSCAPKSPLVSVAVVSNPKTVCRPVTLWRALVAQRHALELIEQPSPVVSKHLCVLDSLSSPVLVPAADVVLRRLERDQFVADALLDKDGTVMLLDNGFLVLFLVLVTHIRPRSLQNSP